MGHYNLNWNVDHRTGHLIVTMKPTDDVRLELLSALYPSVAIMSKDIYNFPRQLARQFDADKRVAQTTDREWRIKTGSKEEDSRYWFSWNDIEYDIYSALQTNSEYTFYEPGYQEIIPLWGGPLIASEVITNDNNEFLEATQMWTNEQYVHYDSPASIDTLVKTGKVVWTPVPSYSIAPQLIKGY